MAAASTRIITRFSHGWINFHWRDIFFFYFYFLNSYSYQTVLCTVPTSYEETLKPTSSSSIIIPTSVLERDVDKYNQNNNNNSISNLSIGNNTSTNTALKIEEVSNETSNLMIEDRQNSTTSTTSTVAASTRYVGVMRSDL
jgi:hypothetical protein